jgi:hypothetical protein
MIILTIAYHSRKSINILPRTQLFKKIIEAERRVFQKEIKPLPVRPI